MKEGCWEIGWCLKFLEWGSRFFGAGVLECCPRRASIALFGVVFDVGL